MVSTVVFKVIRCEEAGLKGQCSSVCELAVERRESWGAQTGISIDTVENET